MHKIRIYLIVSMNAAHVSIQAAQFSEHTTALLTEERLGSLGLCMHSLQHSTSSCITILQWHCSFDNGKASGL